MFGREGEGESLEFGYCFDVSLSSGTRFMVFMGIRSGINRLTRGVGGDVGCYTSVFSGVGVVVRHAVHPVAAGGEG